MSDVLLNTQPNNIETALDQSKIFLHSGEINFAFELLLLWCLPVLLIVVAYQIIKNNNLLACAMYMAIFSFMMALIYLVLKAPDVAITEASVGAGISTVLILGTLVFTGSEVKQAKFTRSKFFNLSALLVCFALAVVMIYVSSDFPAYGDPLSPAHSHVAAYYINSSFGDIGIPNVVTSVLASYRGFDTFGEVVVVFTAAVCVMMILHCRKVE